MFKLFCSNSIIQTIILTIFLTSLHIANAEDSETKPINNDPILIDPSSENTLEDFSANKNRIMNEYYQTYEGGIGDHFIPFRNSNEFISVLPYGRQKTITKAEIIKIKRKQIRQKNSEMEEYFIMRKRLLAPTLRN